MICTAFSKNISGCIFTYFLSPVFARRGVNSRIEGGPWGGRDHGRGTTQDGRGGGGMELKLLNGSQKKKKENGREKKSMYDHT